MIKKILTVLLVLLAAVPLAVFCGSMDVSAETSWDFDAETGTLTISGTGNMPNIGQFSDAPWEKYKSQISRIVIDDGVTSIGNWSFSSSTVKVVKIPDTVAKIGDSAFENCKQLYKVILPNSITQLGKASFSGCSSLEELTLSDQLQTVSQKAFEYCVSLKKVTIPSSVKKIDERAFYNDSNLDVTFSEGLQRIEKNAFWDTGIGTLTVPDSVTYIGDGAFARCKKLTKLITGENLVEIGSEAFDGGYSDDCVLSSVDLRRSQKLKTIGEGAFDNAPIISLEIPDSVTDIKNGAFQYCYKLTEVKLPANLINIGSKAFLETALTSIDIPDKVKTIGSYAFQGTNLKKVVIPHSVTNVYRNAFWECKLLTAVDISGFNLTLDAYVFQACYKINHVHISDEFGVSYYAGKSDLPTDESCYFQIGADGKCPAAHCPFRDGDAVVGDVNGDGKLNNTDIILLGRSYMAGDSAKYIAVADMNNDGKITNTDIILLGRLYMSMQ